MARGGATAKAAISALRSTQAPVTLTAGLFSSTWFTALSSASLLSTASFLRSM